MLQCQVTGVVQMQVLGEGEGTRASSVDLCKLLGWGWEVAERGLGWEVAEGGGLGWEVAEGGGLGWEVAEGGLGWEVRGSIRSRGE